MSLPLPVSKLIKGHIVQRVRMSDPFGVNSKLTDKARI